MIDFQKLDDKMRTKNSKKLIAFAMKQYSPTWHQYVYKLHIERRKTPTQIATLINEKNGKMLTQSSGIRTLLLKMGAYVINIDKKKKSKPQKYKECHAPNCNAGVPAGNFWLCDSCKRKRNSDVLQEHSVGGAIFLPN